MLVLLIVFAVLLSTQKLDCIQYLISSNNLATTPQINISSFLPPFWLEVTNNKACLFLVNWSWMTWYKPQRNHVNNSCMDNLHACCCMATYKVHWTPDDIIRDIQTAKDASSPTSTNHRLLTGFRNWVIVCSSHYFLFTSHVKSTLPVPGEWKVSLSPGTRI